MLRLLLCTGRKISSRRKLISAKTAVLPVSELGGSDTLVPLEQLAHIAGGAESDFLRDLFKGFAACVHNLFCFLYSAFGGVFHRTAVKKRTE